MNGYKVALIVGTGWQLLVLFPIWFLMLFGVLSAANAPGWSWGLFYAYIPIQLVGLAISVTAGFLREESRK